MAPFLAKYDRRVFLCAVREPNAFNSRIGRLMEEAGRVWARAKADESMR